MLLLDSAKLQQVLQNIIKPYRCVSLDFLAKEINVTNEEAPGLDFVQRVVGFQLNFDMMCHGVEGALRDPFSDRW